MRFEGNVRAGAVSPEEGSALAVELRAGVEALLETCNGDWRNARLEHYASGSVDHAGFLDVRGAVCAAVCSAIEAVGLMGGVVRVVPSKNRWGTCARALAAQMCTCLRRFAQDVAAGLRPGTYAAGGEHQRRHG